MNSNVTDQINDDVFYCVFGDLEKKVFEEIKLKTSRDVRDGAWENVRSPARDYESSLLYGTFEKIEI